jgi:hypothetical protein
VKLTDARAIPGRLKILLLRTTRWGDEDDPINVHVHKETWKTAWAIVGVHSYNWWWVCRYGKLGCGCTRNPLTRRMVLYLWGCEKHCPKDWVTDEEGPIG